MLDRADQWDPLSRNRREGSVGSYGNSSLEFMACVNRPIGTKSSSWISESVSPIMLVKEATRLTDPT